MITSSVLFGIAIALSGSIAISSFEFGNATNSIKGNQFVDTPGPLDLGKSCIRWILHKVYIHLLWIYSTIATYFSLTVNFDT